MRSFLTVLLILVIPLLAVLAIVFYAADGAITIVDSGSTNTHGFTLSVNPNGSGIWTDATTGNVIPFDSFTVDYVSLVKAVRKFEVLKELFITKPTCAHSTSFGSTETLSYNFLTSGDVSCISDQDFQNALSSVVATGRNLVK